MTNNMLKSLLIPVIGAICMALSLQGCIEDGFSSSPADRPTFSTDTLDMGTVITTDVSTTRRFTVRNPHAKGMIISDIHIDGANAEIFRLNVDGFSGTSFNNVEIRPNDSIYVLVSCTLPPNGQDKPVDVDAAINFTVLGVTDRVVLRATGQDVERLKGQVITHDTTFDLGRPYQVFDSLVVAKDTRLTLAPGTTIMFHQGAYMRVYGTLESNGTPDAPVTLRGDRTGDVITGITFDLMAGQWQGLEFAAGSHGNVLSHTTVRNTAKGVIADRTSLEIINSRLRNSQFRALTSIFSDITAVGSEFAEAPWGDVYLAGGNSRFEYCTFPNYYLFSAIYSPAIVVAHLNAETAISTDDEPDADTQPYTVATFVNSIIYGLGNDITPGDLNGTSVTLNTCLLKSTGTDDDNFLNCLWNTDPLYYTVREDYIFDYRLRPESPAIRAANPSLATHPAAQTDAYGVPRGNNPDLGAYVFIQP